MSIHIQFVSSSKIKNQDETLLILPNTLPLERLRQLGAVLTDQDVTFSADSDTATEFKNCASGMWKQTGIEGVVERSKPSNDFQSGEFKEIVRAYFLKHAWGGENQIAIRQLEFDAEEYLQSIPDAKAQLLQAKTDGEQAYQLVGQLKERMSRDIPDQVDEWLKSVSQALPYRVKKSLKIELDKTQKWRAQGKVKSQINKGYRITSQPVVLKAGVHPNYLPALRQADNWTVVIDETGTSHDSGTAVNDPKEKVGKFVALVVPDSVRLPPLGKCFHATDKGHQELEKILKRLSEEPLGIFGFEVTDPAASGQSWYLQVDLLIRWVLRLLPIDASRSTIVRFEIEQRDSYTPSRDLSIRGESILCELKQLSASRYGNLSLNMKFVSKEDCKLNGYVDTIANCWGSPDPIRKKLLRHFKLLDHCLLTPGVEGLLERALIAMNDGRPLSSADWYTLVSSVQSFDSRTLIDDFLMQLGQRSQNELWLWRSYLAEVKERISMKSLAPHSLAKVIGWLEQYKPLGQSIPKIVELQFRGAKLTLENHQGLSIQSSLLNTMSLAFELLEEDAPKASEVILRAVVAMTNAYNFEILTPYVDQLLQESVKVFGLSNYGKILSTRGQLAAFNGDPISAQDYFDQALAIFAKLSDTQQCLRESLQTKSYRLFALLDDQAVDEPNILREFDSYIRDVNGSDVKKALPHISIWDGTRKFAHHLVLRAIVTGRLNREEFGKAYLDSFDKWASGEDHPWQLIAFYRALLLAQNDRIADAQAQIRNALEICDSNPDGTITWIGVVIEQTAKHIGIAPEENLKESQGRLDAVHRSLSSAPIAELNASFDDRINLYNCDSVLRRLLPFNFR